MALKAVPSPLGVLPSSLSIVDEAGGGSRRRGERRFTPNRGKLYGARWQKARALFLSFNPYCLFCLAKGTRTLANVVDHVIPHKGRKAVFWNTDDWQPLCTQCHSRDKQAIEERVMAAGEIDQDWLRELNAAARGHEVPLALDLDRGVPKSL